MSLSLSPPLERLLLDLSFALDKRVGTSDRSWEFIAAQAVDRFRNYRMWYGPECELQIGGSLRFKSQVRVP